MSQITEYKLIDIWYDKELVFPNKKNQLGAVIDNFLCDVFADSGLELDLSSPKYKTVVKRRCERILEKVRDNKKHQKPKYNGFSDPEKIFWSESEFPELLKTTATAR